MTVVHDDDDLVVVDKPHFLATIPRGKHVVETALVRLRRDLGLPHLSPAHRLDRVTAGLVMFVVEPALRGRYQTMFADRVVRKEYEAIAPHDPALTLPTRVSSRIVKVKGVITAQEVPGPPNAETVVELVEHRDGWGRYRLVPLTGRTHQLRLHMASLGVPIRHDDFYPVLREKPLDDFTDPLQLLAKVLEFPYRTVDWQEQNKSLFQALKLEKLGMGLILLLIVLVAAFNIVGMLTMVVVRWLGGLS